MRDLRSNIDVAASLQPAARTNGTATGSTVDRRGYDSALISFAFGAWTDGTHTPSVQHSTDGTSWDAAGTADLQGTLAAVSGTAGQNAVQRVGYVGNRRFVRAMMVTATSTTGALSAAHVVRGNAHVAPLA
jgi:hypothetical protein